MQSTTYYYSLAYERIIVWYVQAIGMQLPDGVEPIPSAKDPQGQAFAQAEVFA